MAAAQARLDEASEFADRTRSEGETARAQAAKESARLAEEAREKAEQIVAEAKASAERIRADTDRELAAATQRRDSINAQLANVRQMLATLTGTAPFSLTGFGDAEEAWAEPDSHSGEADDTETPDVEADAPSDEESLAHRS
jgi:cell division septum initiation protein DivIVA